ncbi:uncharacterized protein NPIL_150861 [Nephila pilipes]|uniref:MATH domain-containing protein n=1 Tax=Nephila pilipes TaxID=299642 RepID=A0A8X6QJV2_NEPPI|nr:uncharacterized protein NPIL_150861 [Nephila pilipes]
MDLRLRILFQCLCLLLQATISNLLNAEADDNLPLAQVKELPSGPVVAEFDWLVPEILLQTSRPPRGHTHYGPVFLTSRPGYKLRLAFTIGHTNPLDGLNYLGLWFSLAAGPYDETLRWPFPYAVNLTLVSRSEAALSQHVTVQQSLAQCRMRPGPEEVPNEGCGKAFLVPHEHVLTGPFLSRGELLVRATVFLEGKSTIPRRARVFMKSNQLVSEFLWEVDTLPSRHSPVNSEIFQLDSDGYLLQLQLTLAPEGRDVGLFATLLPSPHDSTLSWPFTLPFELALLDRKGGVDPGAGGTCPQVAFRKPHPDRANPPCGFRKIGTLGALRARAFNRSGVVARFTAVLDRAAQKASLTIKGQHLVAEYVWRIPHIERKLHLAKADRLNNLLSDRFYSSEQGYLLQLQLKFQNRSLGLYLTLLEGVNDALLRWPFDKPFTLSVVDQQQVAGAEDALVSINPSDPRVGQEACPESFWRPFGRNDACGSANALSYDQLYERKFIRYGAILLKAVLFLEELRPPRFASLTIEENHLSARFEWLVPDLQDKIRQVREGRLAFLDSDKFYLSNNGYRMMLRLYPEKGQGFVGLYAVLTKGAYDDELRWPFNHAYRLEVIPPGGSPAIQRTTHPGRGCPDIAFQKPDRELSEWSCGEGHMVAHDTLLKRSHLFSERKDTSHGPLPYEERSRVLIDSQAFPHKDNWTPTGSRPFAEQTTTGFQLKPNSFVQRDGRTFFRSNPYIAEVPPIGSHSIAQEERIKLPESSPYSEVSLESRPYTEEASEVSPHNTKEGSQHKSHSLSENEAGIRFAITVFLQELTPPVASLRLEGGILVAKYSWTVKDVTANLELLQSLEKNRLESPVFYSENQGYAMRLALSLTRRPDHRNTVSSASEEEQMVGLYWTLHAGQHDHVLRWPFSSTVTLSLIEGRNGHASLQKVIDPSRSKCPREAFERPSHPHNEHSCGFAAVINLQTLFSNYVQNDVLHIKVSITLPQA